MKLTLVLRDKKNQLRLSTKSIESFITRIQTDTKDGIVARRRKQLTYGDYIESYDRQFPSHVVYPSAVFEKDANNNIRMKAFNGVVALTVDGLDSQADIDAVKQAARILHYTLAAFIGPSGHEVIILVRVAKSEAGSSPIAQPDLSEEEADTLCREGHGLATALYQAILSKPIRRESASLHSCFRMPLDDAPSFNPEAISLPVNAVPLTLSSASDTPHMQESAAETDTEEEASDTVISNETRRLMDFLNAHYQFRFNTVMGYTEYKDQRYRYMDWAPVDDRVQRGMTMAVRLGGIDMRDNDVRRYVQSNMIRTFDPVGDYLWSVYGKWDGTDHIRRLARTVPTKNPYWEYWFYTWFLGMVRQWQVTSQAKYGNQAVPLLISGQGWNKTTFCEQLLPQELSWGYTGNQDITEKRQVLQAMAQMLLINLDEFNQISPKVQQGFLKNIITLSSIKIKRPYSRHVEDMPRRASFIATTNQADVLADPTGNRRFLGVELTGPIDISTPPNHEQLYAQAMEALQRREPCYFNAAQSRQIMESNRRFNVRSAAEQYFLDYFEPAANEQEGEWVSASAIFEHLKNQVGVSLLKPANVASFGRRLSSIPRLQRRETNRNSEYLVRRRKH